MENEKEFLVNDSKAVAEDTAVREDAELAEEQVLIPEVAVKPEKKSGTAKIVLISVVSTILAIALLGAMTYLVLKGAGIIDGWFEKTPEVTESAADAPDHTHTVDDAIIVTMVNNMVAECGELELNNAEFQIYYESNIISYQQSYGYYLMYMGVDLTQALDTQIFDESTGETWQDIMIETSFQTWHAYAAIKQYAEAEGFTIDAEGQAELDGIDAKIEENAVASGYATAEELVKNDIAPGATVDGLRNYMIMNTYYGLYIEHLEEKYKLSPEEAEQYYNENEEILAENGISKADSDIVDVRHVLIQLDDVEADSSTQVDYTDEQWEQCRVKAQEIYDSWLAGEATEDTFAQLAMDNSKDGNAADGGLYTGVTRGYMVEAFDSWIFDDSRVAGDSGLVKTPFGYHIMYFVKRDVQMVDDVPQYISDVQNYVLSEKINEIITTAMETYPLETYLDKVGVSK